MCACVCVCSEQCIVILLLPVAKDHYCFCHAKSCRLVYGLAIYRPPIRRDRGHTWTFKRLTPPAATPHHAILPTSALRLLARTHTHTHETHYPRANSVINSVRRAGGGSAPRRPAARTSRVCAKRFCPRRRRRRSFAAVARVNRRAGSINCY